MELTRALIVYLLALNVNLTGYHLVAPVLPEAPRHAVTEAIVYGLLLLFTPYGTHRPVCHRTAACGAALIVVANLGWRLVHPAFALLYVGLWPLVLRLNQRLPGVSKRLGFTPSPPLGWALAVALGLFMLCQIGVSLFLLTRQIPRVAPPRAWMVWAVHSASLNSLAEEVFYRGHLFHHFRRLLSPAAAAFGTSTLYALPYALLFVIRGQELTAGAAAFYMLLFSFAACWLREQTGSLWPCLLLSFLYHASLNFIEMP